MTIEASFVRSAASTRDLPRDGLAEIALVGRSNVGKSSLINALVRRTIARTSAAPGKTRLANIYRVARGGSRPFYLVDLPGYGYARGRNAAAEFGAVAGAYFGQVGRVGQGGRVGECFSLPAHPAPPARPAQISALLLVDMRHPGLESDIEAWRWLRSTVPSAAIVATKLDKLTRGERIRAQSALESVFDRPVLPVSAASGEGLDELWKLIDRLASSSNSHRPHSRRPDGAPPSRPPTKGRP